MRGALEPFERCAPRSDDASRCRRAATSDRRLSARVVLRDCLVSLLIGTVLLTGAGCAVMQPIRPTTDPSRPAYGRIKSGQFVVLHLDDGRRVELVVDRIEPDGIVAVDGRRYGNNEITRAEVRRLTKGEAVVISVLIGAGIFVYLLAQAFGNALDDASF